MRREIPVEPDAETARRWAEDELSGAEYGEQGRSLLERLQEWILGLFGGVDASGSLPPLSLVLVLVLLAAIVFAAIYFAAGPLRRSRAATRRGHVFEDDARSAADMRTASERAAAANDWGLAVLERYRAIVRGLEERGILNEGPGITAHEAATAIVVAFPEYSERVFRTAEGFDAIRYGFGRGDIELYRVATDLDRALMHESRPTVTA